MSWGTCYSGSNNLHFNFPPIMSDGRNYATWQPGAVINEKIREKNNIESNFQYRMFLQDNAKKIMETNTQMACNNCGACPPLFDGPMNPVTQPNHPYIFNTPLENNQPFGYQGSDLKNLYISRNDLQARMIAPALSQYEYIMRGIPSAN